jgi:N-hydroxyarylamine O-acetyltransferase
LSLVELDGKRWIADVGFGFYGITEPLPLETGVEHEQRGFRYRLVASPPWGTMLQVAEPDGWQNLYSFDLETVCQADIEMGNHYTATSKDSLFTFMRVAYTPTASGKRTLTDLNMSFVVDGEERREAVSDDKRYLDALVQHFGLDLGVRYEALPPVPVRASGG